MGDYTGSQPIPYKNNSQSQFVRIIGIGNLMPYANNRFVVKDAAGNLIDQFGLSTGTQVAAYPFQQNLDIAIHGIIPPGGSLSSVDVSGLFFQGFSGTLEEVLRMR